MSSPQNPFQIGAEAFQQKRYPEAIQALETFCRNTPNRQAKEYFQAQMWLVKAYQETGQTSRAIALCRHMGMNTPPQVQDWAQRVLPMLTRKVPVPETATPQSEPQPESPPTASEEPPVQSAQGSEEALFPTPPLDPTLSPEDAAELYQQGNKALKMKRFADAVEALEAYCRGADSTNGDYPQAQTYLVKAYAGNDQLPQAIALCQHLRSHNKPFIKIWADKYILQLDPKAGKPAAAEATGETPEGDDPAANTPFDPNSQAIPKAGRATKTFVTLAMKGVAGNLALASTVTVGLLAGMVLVLSLALILIQGSDNPTTGLVVAIAITLIFITISFFLSPFIMDIVQQLLYGTRWTTLAEIERYSPESARVIRNVCSQKKLTVPRLGIISDENPTAFTYGSLPNSARLVVSQGLFTYLDDDEVATVYAHELGHIVHWDFAVMTLAAALVQITYLLYVYIDELAEKLGDSDAVKQIKSTARMTALMAYVFYVAGEYLIRYLSRTREYYADHFAAEVTGNPNGLARALVKIAYGILEEGQREQKPSRVLMGTRALGISDPNSATLTGTAFRVASDPQKVGRVFMWDMFNPWGWVMELSSTHPLTGKRIRALSTYAEQLGIGAEFDIARVVQEGKRLSKKRLYGNFVADVLLLWAEWIGAGIGFLVGGILFVNNLSGSMAIGAIALIIFGFGIGTLFKTFVMYPSYSRVPVMDVLTLMSDPYASPLRGRPVKLTGTVIGKGDSGARFGSDFKMRDQTGMIFLRYSSRFGPLGNFLFGMTQADSFINREVAAVGWFRRGIMPWVDLVRMDCPEKWTVHSYHRFWSFMLGFVCILLSFALPVLTMQT